MRLRRCAPALSLLLSLLAAGCAAGNTRPDRDGYLPADEPAVSAPEAGEDSGKPVGIQDPHDSTSAKEYNIFIYGDFEELRREYVWLWNSKDSSIPGVTIQTAATQMILPDDTNSRYYVCNALTLDFDTPYLAYSDFNMTNEVEGGFVLDSPTQFDSAIFRAYVSKDGDMSHRSANLNWDLTRVKKDEKHPELGYSIFVNEKMNSQNPGIYYTLDEFLGSLD